MADGPFTGSGNFGYGFVCGKTALGFRISKGGQHIVNGDTGRFEHPAIGKQTGAADPIPVSAFDVSGLIGRINIFKILFRKMRFNMPHKDFIAFNFVYYFLSKSSLPSYTDHFETDGHDR